MKKKIKKILLSILFGALITSTTVFGYASVKYVLNKTVEQEVIVGDTTVYTEGLFVELDSYDNYTLTFFEINETDTQKHYLTYVYNYEVLVDNVDIEVSIVGNDIVVSEMTSTSTQITITFSLNQEKEFNDGDRVNIQFYFEAVEQGAVNINTAKYDELIRLGFTDTESLEIQSLEHTVSSLDELYNYIYIANIHVRFDHLVTDSIIVFE